MLRLRHFAGLIALATLAAAGYPLVHSQSARQSEPQPQSTTAAVPAANPLGSLSCAGQGCHGKSAPEPLPRSAWGPEKDFDRWQSSYTVWKAHDPHTRAYAVLLEERSRQIVARLGESAAHENVRCLACHVNPSVATRADEVALHLEGVDCEACHGNAGTWIASHTTDQTGMAKLASTAERAKVCAGCHVGAPKSETAPLRDVNHDLIAAGHPRLNFDYLTYLRALPPHWTESERTPQGRRPRNPDVADAAIGSAAVAGASLHLLADRATRGPWPEFADFDCSACHHDLPGNRPSAGALRWREPGWASQLSLPKSLELRDAMRRHPGRADEIHGRSLAAADEWHRLAVTWQEKPPTLENVLGILSRMDFARWDEACQGYYLLASLQWSGVKLDPKKMAELRASLVLPRTVDGVSYATPRDYDAARVKELFAQVIPQTRP